jgi:hypothetical protein
MLDVAGQTMAMKVMVTHGFCEFLALMKVFVADSTGTMGDITFCQTLLSQLTNIKLKLFVGDVVVKSTELHLHVSIIQIIKS